MHHYFFPVADLDEIRYNFSTCEATGRSGPTLTQCMNCYNDLNSPITTKGKLFGFGSNAYEGAQGFKVPRSGLYNITVTGAAGGRGVCNFEYGRGLVARLQANLSHEDELLILIGQKGLSPCDLNPDREPCQMNPTTLPETFWCDLAWGELLDMASESNEAVAGGAGGGGASMIWQRRNGSFTDDPLVVAGGGGGSSAVLVYESAMKVYQDALSWFDPKDNSTSCNDTLEDSYRNFLNAKATVYDERLYPIPGLRGISIRDVFPLYAGHVAGSGGGFYPSNLSLVALDGALLSQSEGFASGGLDCRPQFQDPPEVTGGFGGGGGSCAEGGGGGGYSGGVVLGINDNRPGGGGYSALNGVMDIPDFSLNDGDGYVEIVPADCGCVHECAVSGEEFECLCPGETQLAPDENDCFYSKFQ